MPVLEANLYRLNCPHNDHHHRGENFLCVFTGDERKSRYFIEIWNRQIKK
jgi:hypothetical protein